MDNTQQNRPKFKKVKRPIKRFANNGVSTNVAVPSKTVMENPFNSQVNSSNQFNVNDYLESDNLPPMQQDNRLNPAFLSEEDGEDANMSLKKRFMVGNLFTGTAVIAVSVASLILGIFIAKTFLATPTTIMNGLQGVVSNHEVPKGRARCGKAERAQGCVLYVMNPQRNDMNGRDFYDWAAQLTGRQRFAIETANMRYASVKVRPGEIAQIDIPPLQ